MSKAELARRTEYSSAAVAQWEDAGPDGTEPTHESVRRIAEAFDLSLSEFWGDPPKRTKAKAAS